MQERIKLEYGKELCEFSLPSDQYLGTLMPGVVPPLSDLDTSMLQSLEQPVESQPLADMLKGVTSMLILTVDITRPSPSRLMRPILELCKKGNVSVTICISLGRHSKMSESSLRDFLALEVFDEYPVLQHDAFDDSIHLDMGVTSRNTPIKVNKIISEHDFVCGISFIEPSYLMGYSGGRKLIMPGISHHTSIDANHYWLTHPDTQIGELDNNPMHQDAMEFMKHFRIDFLTCAVLDGRDQIRRIYSGDAVKAHRLACLDSDKIFRIRGKTADIVISSPGGYPYDWDLVQGKKAIIPAMKTVKRGGSVILLAACPDGWGAESAFKEWLLTKSPEDVVRDVKKRQRFSLGAHGAYILAKPIVEKEATVIILTNEHLARELQGSYIHATTTINEALELARRSSGTSQPTYLVLKSARRLIVEG